jgi:hypothetical protein
MKVLLNCPYGSVKDTGGATFEPGTGWWSQASKVEHQHIGTPFCSERDAIYVPTLQKNGHPVAEEMVIGLKAQASALGLTSVTQAAGMWVLSETGEVQAETIWICYNTDPIPASQRPALKTLAHAIQVLANQDCVAWEEHGHLRFTDFELESVEFDLSSSLSSCSRMWVVPISDLETVEVRNLLLQANETVISFPGWWGMKWEQIPASFQEQIQKFVSENPKALVYGVKLAGDCEWSAKIIEPYRPGQKSPLQKVAEIVDQQLTDYQKSVVANTTTWIPGLRALGLAQGVIDALRLTDRASQGVSPDQEAQAVRAWEERTEIGQLTIVRMVHSKCATITDRYYRRYTKLLILSADGEANFYGDGAICAELQKKFEGWAGGAGLGQKGVSAFWGGYPNHQEILNYLESQLK